MNFLHYLEKGEVKAYTNALIENFAININKTQGQNFVINKEVINGILSSINLNHNDIIVEVGGGIGTLTFYLLKYCKQIFLYEIDPLLSSIILKVFNKFQDKLEVISGDFLEQKIPNHQKLISNLPYHISSPFIRKIIEMKNRPDILAVTFQKEFADHLCAQPGESEYSRISVYSSFFYKFDIVSNFPPHYFFPTPKIHSSLVRGTRLTPPDIVKDKEFFTFLTNLFCRKHKKVRNNLQVYSRNLTRELRRDYLKEVDRLEFHSYQPINLSPHEILNLFQDFQSLMKNFQVSY
ncbi:MAG: 16S rRNA (adenine(1518)-N(6)/adenine(1519)-N(6))-dimethyltransferase RsmA [Candidatus Hodarchaeota archaeon]